MTLADLIPGRRDRGKHAPDTVIRQLRDDIARLLNRQAAADDFFAVLLDDVISSNKVWRQEKGHREQAESGLVEAWDYIRELEAELAPHRAAEANANRIDVPPMERDTRAVEDQATGPHDVRTLREAAAAGLLGPVIQVSTSGASANPGHASWGVDDTQPLKTVASAT